MPERRLLYPQGQTAILFKSNYIENIHHRLAMADGIDVHQLSWALPAEVIDPIVAVWRSPQLKQPLKYQARFSVNSDTTKVNPVSIEGHFVTWKSQLFFAALQPPTGKKVHAVFCGLGR